MRIGTAMVAAALGLSLAGCSGLADEHTSRKEAFIGALSGQDAVERVTVHSCITSCNLAGGQVTVRPDVDSATLAVLLRDIGDALVLGDAPFPPRGAEVTVGTVSIAVPRPGTGTVQMADLAVLLQDDNDVKEATVVPSGRHREWYDVSVTTSRAADIPTMHRRWAEPLAELSPGGNGTFTVSAPEYDPRQPDPRFRVEGYLGEWERMDLDAFPAFLEEFGVSRFVRVLEYRGPAETASPDVDGPGAVEVTIADGTDIQAATEALDSYVAEGMAVRVTQLVTAD